MAVWLEWHVFAMPDLGQEDEDMHREREGEGQNFLILVLVALAHRLRLKRSLEIGPRRSEDTGRGIENRHSSY